MQSDPHELERWMRDLRDRSALNRPHPETADEWIAELRVRTHDFSEVLGILVGFVVGLRTDVSAMQVAVREIATADEVAQKVSLELSKRDEAYRAKRKEEREAREARWRNRGLLLGIPAAILAVTDIGLRFFG